MGLTRTFGLNGYIKKLNEGSSYCRYTMTEKAKLFAQSSLTSEVASSEAPGVATDNGGSLGLFEQLALLKGRSLEYQKLCQDLERAEKALAHDGMAGVLDRVEEVKNEIAYLEQQLDEARSRLGKLEPLCCQASALSASVDELRDRVSDQGLVNDHGRYMKLKEMIV
jgi:hypothetical protein